MNQFIHIGFGNLVNTSKIIAVVSPESAPIKRLIQNAKEKGTAIDATCGRKTKAVLVMEDSQIVLSALLLLSPVCHTSLAVPSKPKPNLSNSALV